MKPNLLTSIHSHSQSRAWLGVLAILAISIAPTPAAAAAPALPDPAKLITVPELEQIVGKIKLGPTALDYSPAGSAGCEYRRDIEGDDSWVNVEIFSPDLCSIESARAKFGGKAPQSVPEFGKDAFFNPNFVDFSAELFAQKGNFILRVSMPTAPDAVEKLKAIVRKALPRI